jgi:hypothetical protein
MQIFIAYGYNDRDRWIEELVFPLVEAFNSRIIHGKDLQGQPLSEEIKGRIQRSHGLVAFATRRDAMKNGKFSTHRWVTDELAFAIQVGKMVVEVRESDVDDQGGVGGDRARINYVEEQPFQTLIQLTATFARWHQQIRRVHLRPLRPFVRDGIVADIGGDWLKGQLGQRAFSCRYRVLDGDYTSDFRKVELQTIEGRMYFTATQLASGARIQVEISAGDQLFRSEFESVDDVNLLTPLIDVAENPYSNRGQRQADRGTEARVEIYREFGR